jgi:hypothetical protein
MSPFRKSGLLYLSICCFPIKLTSKFRKLIVKELDFHGQVNLPGILREVLEQLMPFGLQFLASPSLIRSKF